jgi:hypothetical protein
MKIETFHSFGHFLPSTHFFARPCFGHFVFVGHMGGGGFGAAVLLAAGAIVVVALALGGRKA